MDIRISCPICGQTEVDSLTDHLQSHSKQSLIEILLLQHQQICRHQPNAVPSVHVVSKSEHFKPIHGFKSRNELRYEHIPVDLLNSSVVEVLAHEPRTKTKSNSSAKDNSRNSVLRIELDQNKATNSNQSSNRHLREVIKHDSNSELCTGPPAVRKPTFVLVDHSPCKAGPSNRRNSENAEAIKNKNAVPDAARGIPPNTSIIQYIIDETGQINDSPQEEPDSWILADGRTIPVYSSLTQVPAVSDTTPSCTMTVDLSTKSHESDTVPISVEKNPAQSHLHLDLMTDEEIPPRGEISEYEESNASSILSEDSNLRPTGILSDSRRSPATVNEHGLFVGRKKKSPKTALTQQYVCYECPQVQVFSSLFELAEHKFESHQNKLLTNITTLSVANDQDSVHILPEKIRQQSHNDEYIPPDIPSHEPSVGETAIEGGFSTVGPSAVAEKEYFCVYCSFTAKTRTELAHHMEIQHAGKPRVPKMFECTHCGKIFRARTNLRKHLLIHKERKFNCPTCSKGFTSNFKLIEHIRVHTKVYPYKCTGCEKTYRTPSLLNHHMKMAHLPEEKRPPKRKLEFYCGICHRTLHSKRSYMNHCQLHKEKPIKCSFCSETFIRRSVLVRHIRITHDPQYESKESKDCPTCHKKLHPNSMIKHMRIHSNEKPYSCNVCGKYFRTYANLTSHSWSHTNVEKPHKCKLCNKSYLFKKNLDNHTMVHKKRTMHFVCNECGVKFTHKVNMKRHLEEHFKDKKHKCKVCGKAFQRHYYLVEHERIHTGVKPYTCNICGKASTTKSNHRAHLKIHDARETGNQEG